MTKEIVINPTSYEEWIEELLIKAINGNSAAKKELE